MSDQSELNLEKAITFFERAEEVASTDNFDYAIEMYLEGLRLAPDALEDGHAPLRRMALIRQAKGGKKPSITEKVRHHGGKTPLEEMINAEYLLAKDPDNLGYAETMLKACVAGGYLRTAEWIAELVFQASRGQDKTALQTWILLKDCYKEMEIFEKAIAACQLALEMKPEDEGLTNELRELSTQLTVQRGRYGEEGDFRKSIKDRESQEKLHRQENRVRTANVKEEAVERARRAVERNASAETILALAEALMDLNTDKGYQDAMKLLGEAYEKTGEFVYKRREGELRLKRLREAGRVIRAVVEKEPDRDDLKERLRAIEQRIEKVGLEHYRLCVDNYPTDLKMKYEYGNRLLAAGRYDEAIPMFQEAQRDPRYKAAAPGKVGLCFYHKGWYDDAVEVFQRALDATEYHEGSVGKDLRYNLARSYEQLGQSDKALDIYRKLAHEEFGYRDIRDRIDRLRSAPQAKND